MNGRRLSARDYKDPRRGGFGVDLARLRQFGCGLGVGLLIAGIVFVADHRASTAAQDTAQPLPGSSAYVEAGSARRPPAAQAANANATANSGSAATDAVGSFDFYRMLPKFEVLVPEHEHGSHLAPAAQIDRPGIYFLQVGSYRDAAVAERIRAQLAKLGINATVQRVAVDTDVWHRVRVGPIRDLTVLNKLRRQLQADDLDSLVIRVDD